MTVAAVLLAVAALLGGPRQALLRRVAPARSWPLTAARDDAATDPFAAASALDVFAACLSAGMAVPAAAATTADLAPGAGRRSAPGCRPAAAGADPDTAWQTPDVDADDGSAVLARLARRSASSGSALAGAVADLAEQSRQDATHAATAAADGRRLIAGPWACAFCPPSYAWASSPSWRAWPADLRIRADVNTYAALPRRIDGISPEQVSPTERNSVITNPIGEIRARMIAFAADDAGMSTVEYAIGTIAAAAFGAILYTVVTGDSIVGALTNIINRALTSRVWWRRWLQYGGGRAGDRQPGGRAGPVRGGCHGRGVQVRCIDAARGNRTVGGAR